MIVSDQRIQDSVHSGIFFKKMMEIRLKIFYIFSCYLIKSYFKTKEIHK